MDLLNITDIVTGSLLVEQAGLTRLVVDNRAIKRPEAGHGPLAAGALARCLDLRFLALRRFEWSALTSLTALSSLSHVSLNFMGSIHDIGPLSACSKLVSLRINWCHGLTDWEPLRAMTGLTSFTLVHPTLNFTVSPFEALTNHPSLLEVTFRGLYGRLDCSPIATCSYLKSLRFHYSYGPLDIGWIGLLTALTSLDLSECEYIISLEALSTCSSLRYVDLRGCKGLSPSSFTCLEACKKLITLLCDFDVELRGGGLLSQTHPLSDDAGANDDPLTL